MVGWLIDPTVDPDDRVIRVAMLGLWSHQRTWEKDITDASLSIGQDDRGVPMVLAGANPRPLSHRTMIRTVHGDRRYDAYQRWSKLLHHDPRATAPLTVNRLGPGSRRSGQGVVREDEHVALVEEIAALLREAGQRQADYFGRTAAPLVEVCDEIVRSVDERLPGIVAAVQQRNAAVCTSGHGRPHARPTSAPHARKSPSSNTDSDGRTAPNDVICHPTGLPSRSAHSP